MTKLFEKKKQKSNGERKKSMKKHDAGLTQRTQKA